jgi:hypothetical protein
MGNAPGQSEALEFIQKPFKDTGNEGVFMTFAKFFEGTTRMTVLRYPAAGKRMHGELCIRKL